MPDKLLTVTNLTKRFGATAAPVIENLSFSIPRGGRVTIFAPTGAGKTTLINILTRLDDAFEGTFTLVAREPATIFQEPRLFPYMTVEENIFLPAKLRGSAIMQALREQYTRWLEVCDLTTSARYYPHQLSGGMKQKVAIVRGFLMNPDFVMLDEPFKSLDPRSKQAIIRHILAAYPGITLLFVTHTIEEAPLLAQSLLLFQENRLAKFVMHDASHLNATLMEAIYG